MAIREVNPTRSELLEVRKKIKLSESGYDLLKMKRDGLILEFFDILEKAKNARSRLIESYDIVKERIAIAGSIEGLMAINSAAFSLKDMPQVDVSSRNIMSIVVPKIEAVSVRKEPHNRGYGIIGTSSRIDEAASAFESLLEDVIVSAEIETTMKRLLEDIESTKRRVNALEFKVIPELKEVEAFISLRLEEMERDNIFRLKRIKSSSKS